MSIPQIKQDVLIKTRQKKKEISWPKRIYIVSVFALMIAGMFYVNTMIKGKFDLLLGIYGSVMVAYLIGKMALSFFYRPKQADFFPDEKISVVVPFFNEEFDSLKGTVKSILEQDCEIHELIVVDDGSTDESTYKQLKEWTDGIVMKGYTNNRMFSPPPPEITVCRLNKNVGKRHAQAWAFKRVKGDIIVTIDSDAYIHPDGIRELIAPFKDEKVKATTGHVNARNKGANLFTKLIDMRYENAFRVERSAQSVTGNILVCSGCFSAYRKEVIMDNIEHYENQTFLGEKVQFGDDRCLTNYAILAGKTVYQSTAKCDTDVPSSLFAFLKQQIRWNKSFFRESLIAIKIGLKKPVVFVWAVLEMLLWILFGVSIVTAVVIKSSTFGLIMVVYYLAYICLSAYARNVFYLLKHPFIFLLAPVYGIIHLTMLIPLRLYALATIKQNGWGTR